MENFWCRAPLASVARPRQGFPVTRFACAAARLQVHSPHPRRNQALLDSRVLGPGSARFPSHPPRPGRAQASFTSSGSWQLPRLGPDKFTCLALATRLYSPRRRSGQASESPTLPVRSHVSLASFATGPASARLLSPSPRPARVRGKASRASPWPQPSFTRLFGSRVRLSQASEAHASRDNVL